MALVAALGCDGSGGGDIDRGGPFTGNKADAAADAAGDARASDAATNTDAAKDAASDAKADAADAKLDVAPGSGGTGVTGSGGASGGGGTGAGGGASVQTCDQCEAANCGAVNMVPDYRTACHDPKDSGGNPAKAAAGPAAGTLRKTLCEAVLTCVRSNTDKCVTWTVETDGFEGVQGCYCGKDTSDDDCQSGKANGPCKAAIEAAAEVGSAASAGPDVAQRLVDWQTYAIGAATNIVQECDAVFCRNSCLGLPGPNSLRATGTGGTVAAAGGRSGGTGGGTGTASGGRTGTGTGGNFGSGGAGTTGSGGAGGGTSGGAGSSGGGVTYNMCRACEQTACPEALNECEQMPGNAEAGPKMGTPRKDLCKAVVACARASKCPVEGDATACYCGTADVDGACMSGGANGPCKAEVEAAAESTDFKDIGPRFVNSDPTMKLPFAIASATDLLGCDGFSCADARCLLGDPAPVATGGAPGGGGAGGRSNTGGVGGLGGGTLGAGGSGGRGGVGGATGTGTGGASATGGVGGGGSAGGNGGGSSTSSVLVNGAFDTTAAPWTAGFGATLAWTGARDAAGNSASGALGVTYANVVDADGTTMGGAQQCVRVNGGAIYSLGAKVVVPSGQGAGSAMVNLSFFPTTTCTGTVNGSYPSTAVTATDAWTMVSGTTVAPAGAQSVLIQLALVKTFRAPALQAYFDAVTFGSP